MRFGLIDNNVCPRCTEIETLQHKLYECSYTKEIWKRIFRLTNPLVNVNLESIDPIKACLAASLNTPLTATTLNAEIIYRIMTLKTEQDYVIHPRILIKSALELLIRRERNRDLKAELETLLNRDQQ